MSDLEQPITTLPETELQKTIQKLSDALEKVIRGKRVQIQLVLSTLLAKGHILLEDMPGTGKTVLARTLAGALSGPHHQSAIFKRVQFTPDLLPMDLLGTHIYDESSKEFVFRKGPLFCHILLADEINRASPKVQSALLEVMAEHQITMGDTTYKLEDVFFTIATQNPIEIEGTYPLPAAQLDRFFIKINMGYADEETEMEIYKNYLQIDQQLHELVPVISLQELIHMQQFTEQVYVHEEIIRSIMQIIRRTRNHEDIRLGASTRAGIAFLKCLRAWALIQGRNFAIEDDLLALTIPVLEHRLVYRHKDAKEQVLPKLLHEEMNRLQKLKLF